MTLWPETGSPYSSSRLSKVLAATAVAALLAVVTVVTQAGSFQEQHEGELFGVRQRLVTPGVATGVVYVEGTLYVADADNATLIAYDGTEGGREIALSGADGLIPNQLATATVDVVTTDQNGTVTTPTTAILVSDSTIDRVFAFDLAGNRLFTMRLEWQDSEYNRESESVPVINGMSMGPQARFRLTDSTKLEVLGAFAAGWAVDFGQGVPGALLVYKGDSADDTAFSYAGANAEFIGTPYRSLTDGGATNEAFGVAFDTEGNLYLVDSYRYTITAYGPDFFEQPLFTFGTPTIGGKTEEFYEPYGVAFWPDSSDPAGGRLFIADAINNRIVAYRPKLVGGIPADLVPLFAIQIPDHAQPYAVAVDSRPGVGKVAISDSAVVDASTGDAVPLDPFGEPLDPYAIPQRVWELQTRNLVAYDLHVLDASSQRVEAVCSGAPYSVRFSLTVPAGRPDVSGATPILTVDGMTVSGFGDGPVDLKALETFTYTYSLTAPGSETEPVIVELPITATATATSTTDVLPREGVVVVQDCSAPPPVVTATPTPEPQLSGVTRLLPYTVDPTTYLMHVELVATPAPNDNTAVKEIEYELFGANRIGVYFHVIPTSGEPVVVPLTELGFTTIKYRARNVKNRWSDYQELDLNLVGVMNRQNAEGDIVDPFFLPGQASFTYTVEGLPDGVWVDPDDATGRRIIGTLSYVSAGSHTVTVTESDGTNFTEWTFTWNVINRNQPPSFSLGEPPIVNEDAGLQTLTDWVTAISPGPPDESDQTVTFGVSNDNSALFAVQPAIAVDGSVGTLTFQTAADAYGTALVTVRARDSGGDTNTSEQTFTITVTGVNDAPSFTKGPDQTVSEDAGAQSVPGWATAISAGPGESSQTVSFIVSNDNSSLFTAAGQPAVSPTGTLTYTPAPDANGSATVTVVIQDDGGTAHEGVDTSEPQRFVITVNPVNDPPTFTLGAAPSVLEDSGAQTLTNWVTAISQGPADELSQTVTFEVSNTNAALFTAPPAIALDGTLTFQVAADAFGTALVTVVARDSEGGTSQPQTFTITVTAVNDAPSFTKGPNQAVDEDAGTQSVPNWAPATSAGPGESSQTVSFIVSNDNSALFTATGQPTVSPTGTLTYTPAPNAHGTATVTVAIQDNGGTANGGVDTSAPQTFVITVNEVNDAPVAAPNSYSVVEATTLSVQAPGVLAGDTDVDSSVLTAVLVAGPSNGALTLNADGSFSYTPTTGFTGGDSFTYRASDGSAQSAAVTVSIAVNPRNQPPVCTAVVVSPSILWPPNHKPVYLTLSGITDPDGDQLTVLFTSILQDEPTNGPGQGNTMQDGGIEPGGTRAWVRPERTGGGDGRVYVISYTASDGVASCSGQVTVSVPHDQSGAPAELSPGSWNSLDGNLVLPPPAPLAVDDAATVATRKSVTIAVLSNDVANGSPLTVTLVSKPAKGIGTATVNADGTITYKASKSTGTASFTYRITDIYGGTATATVTITVTG